MEIADAAERPGRHLMLLLELRLVAADERPARREIDPVVERAGPALEHLLRRQRGRGVGVRGGQAARRGEQAEQRSPAPAGLVYFGMRAWFHGCWFRVVQNRKEGLTREPWTAS